MNDDTDILNWPTESSMFGGALTRTADGRFVWSDGSEWKNPDGTPVFRSETIDGHNFRICGGFVEVPRRTAEANDELHWCIKAALSPVPVWHPRRNFLLVPVTEWDRRRHIPIGVLWPREVESQVIDKAQDLGWQWPGRVAKGLDASRGTVEATADQGSKAGAN